MTVTKHSGLNMFQVVCSVNTLGDDPWWLMLLYIFGLKLFFILHNTESLKLKGQDADWTTRTSKNKLDLNSFFGHG